MAFRFKDCWRVTVPESLSTFVRSLPILIPQDAVLFLSGTPSQPDLKTLLKTNSIPWSSRKWFMPTGYHVPTTEKLLEQIADAIEVAQGTPVEIDVYKGSIFLIRWFDVMTEDSPVYISKTLPQSQVTAFCAKLGCKDIVSTPPRSEPDHKNC